MTITKTKKKRGRPPGTRSLSDEKLEFIESHPHLTLKEIGAVFGNSRQAIGEICKRYNIERPMSSGGRRLQISEKKIERIKALLEKGCYSRTEISRKLNVAYSAVRAVQRQTKFTTPYQRARAPKKNVKS